jgi:hypothetical protein
MYRLAGLLMAILASVATQQQASAQARNTIAAIALKSGESVEVGDLYAAVNCRSTLTATPTVEVMEGPSEVAVTVKEAMVTPRVHDCNKPVKGAKLVLSAKEIEDYSTSKLTVRITFKTKDGETHRSTSYNLTLFPKQE